jgi:hypothetical protein
LRSSDDGKATSISNFHIIVVEKNQLKFSDFLSTQIGMIKLTRQLFQKWKELDLPVKIFKYDDAGESKAFKQSQSSCK